LGKALKRNNLAGFDPFLVF
jgi:translation initiation factor IF-1